MAFDAFFLSAVLEEVRERCIGARIDKIHQPSRDTLILQMHSRDYRSTERLFPKNEEVTFYTNHTYKSSFHKPELASI